MEPGSLPKIIWKELRVALLCGTVLAIVGFFKVWLYDKVGTQVAFVVAVTMLATVCCAKLVGCLLPMGAKKLGFDPAVMASPFITTIVDAISLLLYFQIASHILADML
ncbi:MAG: magnesium transporter [Lachnospiraceae bacterium]|nr:magnesium transporter [Lachnospiraceae bacterium]